MKVEKDKFDTLLHRMMSTPPEKQTEIKSTKNGGKIIPPKPSPAKQ
jgi:hypothetical protein